jgi:hypothetical protein
MMIPVLMEGLLLLLLQMQRPVHAFLTIRLRNRACIQSLSHTWHDRTTFPSLQKKGPYITCNALTETNDDHFHDGTGPSESESSSLLNFFRGMQTTFEDWRFVKIHTTSIAVFHACWAAGRLSSLLFSSPLHDEIHQLLLRSCTLIAGTIGQVLSIILLIPTAVVLTIMVILAWSIIYFLLTIERFRTPILVRLENFKNASEKHYGVFRVLLALAPSLFNILHVCVTGPMTEELIYRLLLPVMIQDVFLSWSNKKKRQRASDNPIIYTLCSVLFALSHVRQVVSTNDDNVVCHVASRMVLTFLVSQQVLVPVFSQRGLAASCGAHVSFNSVTVAIFTLSNWLQSFLSQFLVLIRNT